MNDVSSKAPNYPLLIDGHTLNLREDPIFNGLEVTLKISLGASCENFPAWGKVSSRIPARYTTDDGFVGVSHPALSERGIDRLLFTERSALVKDSDDWTVTVKGVSA